MAKNLYILSVYIFTIKAKNLYINDRYVEFWCRIMKSLTVTNLLGVVSGKLIRYGGVTCDH